MVAKSTAIGNPSGPEIIIGNENRKKTGASAIAAKKAFHNQEASGCDRSVYKILALW